MKKLIHDLSEMRSFLMLWATQSLSGLGSAVTGYALILWSYTREGSALMTALLMVCSYAPYVLCSIFAGVLSDRWDKRRTMLVCDALAAACTLTVLLLLKTDRLEIWHLYIVNAVSGLMNTVQQPASEVATTALLEERHYQRAAGLKSLSGSVTSILTPIIATAMWGLGDMDTVIVFDLVTFAVAFFVLLLGIRIPSIARNEGQRESMGRSVWKGVAYLRREKGILGLIFFLAGINLVASMYNAAFPAMMLSVEGGGETTMGLVNTVVGVTNLVGSILASVLPAPKRRILAIWLCLMLSMSTENFTLAFSRSVPVWCIGAFLGWIAIPYMNANLGVVMRSSVPPELQGRVYAARNALQFFTIPVGYLLGGALVDCVLEPFMASQTADGFMTHLFGAGPGSGAAMLFAILWVMGMGVCLYFLRNRHIWALERKKKTQS